MRVHDVNFFVKLAGALALTIAAWIFTDWRYGLPLTLVTLLALWLAKVPGLRGYLKGASLLVLLVMASWVLNLLIQGETPLDALSIAASTAARLPPVVTLVLSLTFGIIPMLRDDFERIADAQRARGMEIDDVGFLTRLRFALARGVPLLVQAVRMAHSISLSLSISGYDMRRRRTTWRNVGLMVEPRLPLTKGNSND